MATPSNNQEQLSSSGDTLPPDVLRLIFRYFPLRARLYCVSLVCKRWRLVALRLVTAAMLPKSPVEEGAMIQRLPSLVDVRVSRDRLPRTSNTIQRMRIISSAGQQTGPQLKIDGQLRYPQLKSLHYEGPQLQLLPLLGFFFMKAGPSLTSLRITIQQPSNPPPLQPFDGKLTTLRFPHLVDVALSLDYFPKPPLVEFSAHLLRQCSSQLTSINLHNWHDQEGIMSVTYPRLTSLSLGNFRRETNCISKRVMKLLLRAPNLTELSNISVWELHHAKEFVPNICALVRSINVTNSSPVPECTNLRELFIDNLSAKSLTALTEQGLASYVCSMKLGFQEDLSVAVLLPYTAVTVLTLQNLSIFTNFVPLPRLPHLRLVTFCMGGAAVVQVLNYTMTFLEQSAPTGLPSLILKDMAVLDLPAYRAAFKQLLVCARARQVARVEWELNIAHRIDAEQEALLRANSDDWTHVVFAPYT